MKRIILSVIVSGLCSCMSWEPLVSETEAGWTLFRYADAALDTNRDVAMRAVCFDEYFRQTTDEGRREVQDRYFPRERIVGDGNVWRMLTPDYVWTIEMSDGGSLAEAGSAWTISYEHNWLEDTPKSVIQNLGNGVLAMNTEVNTYHFKTTVQTEFRLLDDGEDNLLLEFFHGALTLLGTDTPRLDIGCSILDAVKYRNGSKDPEPGGVLFLTAHNEADNPEDADEQVTGRYLSDGDVEITYRGVTQLRNENESYMRPE